MKWFLVVYCTLGALAAVYMIGKPRKPITPGDAIAVVLCNLAIIVIVLTTW